MRVLVTGSEGSLMQAIIPLLMAQGHNVRGIDNFVRYGPIQRPREYEFIEGDLADTAVTMAAMKNVDGVIQGAARIYGIGGFNRYPAEILAHDTTLHQNILWAALENGVSKIAYISSSMVYERCTKHPCAEEDLDDALTPSTAYGLSKLVCERLCAAFSKQFGLQFVIWRPFNIITPFERGEPEQGTSHVFADFLENIIVRRTNPLPIIGDGLQQRCFTWIEDVARGIAENSFSSVTDGRAYNLGNPEPITMRALAEMAYAEAQDMKALPRMDRALEFKTVASFSDDVRIRIPNVERAATELGWLAKKRTRDSIRACIQHLHTADQRQDA